MTEPRSTSKNKPWSLWDLDSLTEAFPLDGTAPYGPRLATLVEAIGHSALGIGRQWRALMRRTKGEPTASSRLVEYWFTSRLSPRRVYLGIVAVDSGAILISDPGFVLKRDGVGGTDYNEYLDRLGDDPIYLAGGLALVVPTDDFTYPTYGELENGELVRVVIDLNPRMGQAEAYWREHLAATRDREPRPPSSWTREPIDPSAESRSE